MKRAEIEKAKMDATKNLPLLKENKEQLIISITSAYALNEDGRSMEQFISDYMDDYIQINNIYDEVLLKKVNSTSRILEEYTNIIGEQKKI